jgi:hypothetical protein
VTNYSPLASSSAKRPILGTFHWPVLFEYAGTRALSHHNVRARLVYKQKPISHPDLNIFMAKLLSEQPSTHIDAFSLEVSNGVSTSKKMSMRIRYTWP